MRLGSLSLMMFSTVWIKGTTLAPAKKAQTLILSNFMICLHTCVDLR